LQNIFSFIGLFCKRDLWFLRGLIIVATPYDVCAVEVSHSVSVCVCVCLCVYVSLCVIWYVCRWNVSLCVCVCVKERVCVYMFVLCVFVCHFTCVLSTGLILCLCVCLPVSVSVCVVWRVCGSGYRNWIQHTHTETHTQNHTHTCARAHTHTVSLFSCLPLSRGDKRGRQNKNEAHPDKRERQNEIYIQPIPLGVTFSKAQISKLERLFYHVSVKRDVRALSFELWNSIRKCQPKWDRLYIYIYT